MEHNNEPMESDIDIDLQVTIYTIAQAISKGFGVTYLRAKEILNKAIHDKNNNTIDIVTQIFHIEDGE